MCVCGSGGDMESYLNTSTILFFFSLGKIRYQSFYCVTFGVVHIGFHLFIRSFAFVCLFVQSFECEQR